MRNFLVGFGLVLSCVLTPLVLAAQDSRPSHHLYAPTQPTSNHPLVVVLQGYGVPGDLQEYYYSFKERVDAEKFFLLVPEGRRNLSGKPFWDVLFAEKNDSGLESDLAYIKRLINETIANNPIDRKRIYLIGHSNGGYMASVVACALGDMMDGVASISGSLHFPQRACRSTQIKKIIQMCGTTDSCMSAAQSAAQYWSGKFGCTNSQTDKAPTQDFDWTILGKDTVATQWNDCKTHAGAKVILWEMLDGKHIPYLRGQFANEVLNVFLN